MEAEFTHIGRRLQALRRAQGHTLEQLAAACDLTPGYLSQIENGQAVPSLTALHVIAAELGSELSAFFPESSPTRTRVVRRAERAAFRIEPESGEEYTVLAGQVTDRAFSALAARHLPGGGDLPFRHLGEELGVVVDGTIRITVDGEPYDLGPGDWIHYSSHPRHSAQVISDRPVEMLWLLTPALI